MVKASYTMVESLKEVSGVYGCGASW